MKVLLVEDNAADARLILEILKESPVGTFQLQQVARLDSALEQLRQESFDVVLLDLGLSDSQGMETLILTRKANGGLPIVVLTGLDDERFALEAVRAGAQDYLVKGRFGNQLLVRTIRYAIERKRAEEEVRRLNAELERRVAERTEQLRTANDELTEEIIERTRAEEALRSSQAILQSIVGSAMDAVVSVDEQQRIVVFNQAAETVFQCAASEVLGSTLDRFIPKSLREVHREHIRRFGAHGVTQRSMTSPAILLGVRSDGEEFPIEATISQVQADGEKLYTVILRDITERKQAEQALLSSEKLASVGRMASTIAHEINNPLETIGHALYLALTDPETSQQAKSYLELAIQELDRVTHITRQTLAFNREVKTPTLIDLRASIDSVVKLFALRLKSREITIEKSYAEVGWIRARGGEVQQIISNLLSNSMDATPNHGKIEFRVSSSIGRNGSRCVRFAIADTGSGIAPERLNKIFEPFFTTKEVVGTGLGLWITKQIVEKHGATIRVRSKVGSGTVFSIAFPISEGITEARS